MWKPKKGQKSPNPASAVSRLLSMLNTFIRLILLSQTLTSSLSILVMSPPPRSLSILDPNGNTYIYPLLASLISGSEYDIPNPLPATDLDLDLRPVSGPWLSPFRSKLNFQSSHSQNFSFLATSPTADGRKLLNHYDSQLMSLSPSENKHDWLSIILLLSGDLHQNPGPRPPKFPCGICKKACTNKTPAVACDRCNIWFHTKCMAMNSAIYRDLENVSWYCSSCQAPNFSSRISICESSNFDSLFNPFDSLSPSKHSHIQKSYFEPSSHPTKPLLTSTPNPKKKSNHKPIKNDISILNANFQSLWKKRVELSNLASDTKSDIIVGTETWLKADIKNSELLLDEYDIYRRDRKGIEINDKEGRDPRGGGVLIAVKKSLTCELISTSQTSETISVKIKLKGQKKLIICAVYRPPDYSLEQSLEIVNEIRNIFNRNKGAKTFVCGDFNLPDVDWVNQEIKGHQYLKSINEAFIEMSHDLGMSQIVDIPTRGQTILDLCFTNFPHLVNKCHLIAGLGDHEIVRIAASISPPRKKPIKREILLWKKVDEVELQKDVLNFRNTFLEQFSDSKNVNDIWDFIKKGLNEIIKKHVPSKLTSSRFHQPWVNSTIKKLIRKKNRWYKKAKASNSERVWEIYKAIKRESQKSCRQTHDQYLNNLFTGDKSNKKLWGYIKSKRQENCGIGDLEGGDGVLARDPVEKANIIHDQFDSVFSNPIPKIKHYFDQKSRLPNICKININRSGLLKLLLNINIHKSDGPDNVPGRLLKLCANELVDVYQILFQVSLDSGVVPPDWKEANVVPLFKKGDKSKPENYRPISLTSLSCKLLEHVVHSNIMCHLDRFKVLDNAQHGFRKRRSCATQLISTLNEFADCLNKREQIDAILLDFSKAFDKVDHEGLLMKLEHLGIRNSLHSWCKSFLIGRSQKVLVEGKASDPKPVLSGVPQGTVMGPLFFLIYINDISGGLTEGTKLKLFADDSFLYRTIKSVKDTIILQKDLKTLEAWGVKWKMVFHPGKCQHLRITNKIKFIPAQYSILGTTIEETESAKYLGIFIDSSLKYKEQYREISKKANGVLALLKRNFPNCPMDIKAKCYTTLVRPSLEYGCPVWDPGYGGDIKSLEKIQKRGARFATGNYLMKTGESKKNRDKLGWDRLEERRLQNKVIIFHKARLNLIDIETGHLTYKSRETRMGGGELAYNRPTSAVDSHAFSFFPSTIKAWNRLPAALKSCKDMDQFAILVKNHNLTGNYNMTVGNI